MTWLRDWFDNAVVLPLLILGLTAATAWVCLGWLLIPQGTAWLIPALGEPAAYAAGFLVWWATSSALVTLAWRDHANS